MIWVTGIGPGNPDLVLPAARAAMVKAEVVIGSRRQLATIPEEAKGKRMVLPKFKQLKAYLEENLDREVCLLASGDPMFFGVGSWVGHQFPPGSYRIVPGISSATYLFSRLGLSMNDCYFTSSHGRVPDWDRVQGLDKVCLVTDEKIGPYQLAQKLLDTGDPDQARKLIYIGEDLSYPQEKISRYSLENVPDREYGQNVVILMDGKLQG